MNTSLNNRDLQNRARYNDTHSGRAWLAIFMTFGAWGLQELAGWLLSDFACSNAVFASEAFDATTLRAVQIAISVVALVVALIALSIGVRAWRGTPARGQSFTASHRNQFVATLALLVSAAFTVAILWAAVGPVILPLCERGQ